MNNSVNITKIVYKVNLNFKLGQEYVNYLVNEGFLEEKIVDNKKTYSTTDKGRKFIERFRDLNEMIDTE